MKRRYLAAAAMLLLLTGCSASNPGAAPAEAPVTAEAPAPASKPTPTAEQRAELLKAIGPLAPAESQERIVTKAGYVCDAILRGSTDETLLKSATTHFERSSDPVTPEEAAAIVTAVKSNGFCQ